MTLLLSVGAAFGLTALLTNIFQRKQEAKNPYVRLVEVTDETTDPAPWGMNWPREYDGYRRTADVDPHPLRRLGGAARREDRARPVAQAHVRRLRLRDRLPRSARPRLHAVRPGADEARDHAPAARHVPPLPRRGDPDLPPARRRRRLQGVRAARRDAVRGRARGGGQDRLLEPGRGRHRDQVRARRRRAPRRLRRLPRPEADGAARHAPRVPARHPRRSRRAPSRRRTSRASSAGAKATRERPYDPNVDATRQEMRSFVCGQCHVEYYCGPKTTLFFPGTRG